MYIVAYIVEKDFVKLTNCKPTLSEEKKPDFKYRVKEAIILAMLEEVTTSSKLYEGGKWTIFIWCFYPKCFIQAKIILFIYPNMINLPQGALQFVQNTTLPVPRP